METERGMNGMDGDLMCVWRPRQRGASVDGMALCEGCEEVLVRGTLCDGCRRIDAELEARRLALGSPAVARPMQPRVQMGIAPRRRLVTARGIAHVALALGLALLVCGAVLAACVEVVQ